MRRKRDPLFVERAAYRKRRMADAARLLPIVGVMLFGLPMLWPGADGAGAATTHVMGYIFGIWLLLTLLAAGLSAYLSAHDNTQDEDGPEAGG